MLDLVLFVLVVVAFSSIPLFVLSGMKRQMRGTFGRSYDKVVADMMRESARRSELLTRYVEARETRIARLERRAEGGR